MTKPSVEDKLAETFAGRTLDAWSWIARARAAAARATGGGRTEDPAGQEQADPPRGEQPDPPAG